MNNKILIMLSALILFVYPMTAYAVTYNQSSPARFTVNYVIAVDTTFVVQTALGTQTTMNFNAGANGRNAKLVNATGQNEITNTAWGNVTNLGAVYQDFNMALSSDNPSYIELIMASNKDRTGMRILNHLPQQPDGFRNVASGNVVNIWAWANFTNAPLGTPSRTLILSGNEHQTLDHIVISPVNPFIPVGGYLFFTGTPIDTFGSTIAASPDSFSSGTPGTGTIDNSGNFTALAVGTSTIGTSITLDAITKSDNTLATVYAPTFASLLVSPASVSLDLTGMGETTQSLSATPKDQHNNNFAGATVSWSTTIGTLSSSSGYSTTFTASGTGTGTIYANSTDGSTWHNVTVPVSVS